MDVEALVETIGGDRFALACEWAGRTAVGTGGRVDPLLWPPDLQEVPHDLSDVWSDSTIPLLERLGVAQQLYRLMPCYGLLMYFKHAYDHFEVAELDAFWSEYRLLLDHDDDRLADPVAYSLWVDFYEDRETVDRAWHESTYRHDDPASARRLRRILPASGPVPYSLKGGVYAQLAADRRWHEYIARGLIGSAFDVYGDLDLPAARSLLVRLTVDDEVPGVSELRRKLDGR